MDIMEIVLLVAGGIIFILSFLVPVKKEEISEETQQLAKEEISNLVSRELENVREHVDEVVSEAVEYAVEKTERSLERLSNEKIMAVNEYSDTVLSEIHKNHEEAMFLYDMLNSKHINLKDTVTEVNRTVKEAEETVTNFQKMVPEIKEQPESMEPVETESVASTIMQNDNAGRVSFLPEESVDGVNNNDRILELYRQGKSKIAIAKELGLGVGEVKLVIDLFKNQ